MYKPCLNTYKNIIKNIVLILSILSFSSLLFAKDALTGLQKQARIYRAQGLEYQQIENLDRAMSFYQKAIELDPLYAIPYNDLGIIYEAKGNLEQAEEYYLKATKIDPNYLSPCSNLALFYENKRDLPKAAFYWKKRVELGSSGDPWTAKARMRLNDIQAVFGEKRTDSREQDIINFMKDVAIQKAAIKPDTKVLSKKHPKKVAPLKKGGEKRVVPEKKEKKETTIKSDTKALAKKYLEKAKLSYKKEDWLTALKEAIDAKSLDPDNREIDDFLDKVKIRLLSK